MAPTTSSDQRFFTLFKDTDSLLSTIQSCLNTIASLATILAIPVAIYIFLQWKKQRLSNRLFESLLELMELSTLLRYCCVNAVYSVIANDIHWQNPRLQGKYAEDTFERNNYTQYRIKLLEVLSAVISRVDVKYALAKNLKSRPKYLKTALRVISRHVDLSHMSYCRLHCNFLSPDQEDSVIQIELAALPKDYVLLTEIKKKYLDKDVTFSVINGQIDCIIVENNYDDLWETVAELAHFLFSFYSEQLVRILSANLNDT